MSDRDHPIGFLVWNPARDFPTHVHGSFLAAVAEADRLKRQNPGQRFVVMSPVEDMSGVGYALGWDRGRQEGLAQAHREIMAAEARSDRFSDELDDLRPLKVFRDRRVAFQAIVADCLLWFNGFSAAFEGKDSWERPTIPERDKLRELNGALQVLLPGGDDQEIPF